MAIVNRPLDLIFNNNDLKLLDKFEKFPVFMGCTNENASNDLFMDMNFYISESSGIIQIDPLPSLDLIYQHSHQSGTVGSAWGEHHKSFSSFIRNYNPSSVLEIGGGSGILSVNFKNNYENIQWSIIDPNPTPVKSCSANFIKTFFDNKFVPDHLVDCIVHSHVLEHVFDPDMFLRHISDLLSVGKQIFFSVPNLLEMLKKKFTNAINFEHTVFLTEPYVEYLLAKNGFKIIGKQYFLSDHSIFYAAVKENKQNIYQLPDNLFETNKQIFLEFMQYYSGLITHFNNLINDFSNPIYLFGAHVFSQFLINRGLDVSKVISILDNDVEKQGKRLYGTNLYVESPTILKNLKNPIVILKVSNYADEIKTDILQNINETAIFLEETS